MKLQKKLDEMKAQFESSVPSETLAVMHSATKSLMDSNYKDKTLKTGFTLPEFALSDQAGKVISSGSMLKKGPLIVSFYRGVW